MTGNDIHAVERGWTVRGSDGASLGSVAEVTDAYLRLSGHGEDLYVPAARLAEVRPGEVRLDVAAGEVDRGAWSSPPEGHPGREDALINVDEAAGPVATPGDAGYSRDEIAHMAHPDYAAQGAADDERAG
ncbi:MAG TPA: hypothetical protein VHK06_04080 [Candidatus Limnocylindria bacterium]|nr:hypothetical protein [Candidatus Limnocylindria bacterium]